MLFRYKITMCNGDSFDRIFHGYARRYNVEIQCFKPNSKLLKWRLFESERLCCILRYLGHEEEAMYDVQNFEHVFKQYKDMDEIMIKYIKQKLEKINTENKLDQHSKEIDNMIVTNGWHTIEVKENE